MKKRLVMECASKRYTVISAVHLFLVRDDKVLLLRRFNTGYGDGNYSVVAGHIDGREDVFSAMIREAREEVGVDISRNDLKAVHCMHRQTESDERMDWFFMCDKWNGEVTNMEPDKCDELKWTDIGNLPDNMVDYVREAVNMYKEGIKFSVYGW